MTDTTTPVARECRFAVYSKSNEPGEYSDIHLVKEAVHDPATGKTKPNVLIIKNYERPFFVSKRGQRSYTQKREWTDKSEVDTFKSTQTNLPFAVAKALGTPWVKGGIRELAESPYLYGTDMLSTSIIKQSYTDKWPVVTPYSNAVFDTETDVVHGTGHIQMATISFKDKVFTAVLKKFVAGYANPIESIQKLAIKYIKDVIDKRNITIEIVIVDREIDIVKATMAKAHEWKPDFLSVWNLEFDVEKVMDACQRAQIDIATILSDPKVPKEYQNFRFKKGAAKRVTASGKVMSFKPSQRWHTVFCPSSFYWIDAMSAYRQIRTGDPEEPSYSLESILQLKLKIGKLKFTEADHLSGLEWHKFMQSKYPLEYVVYNIFDCVSMEILDEKTLDLQLSLPMFSGSSDFQHFNSQPKRAANRMHWEIRAHDKVMGSTSSEMSDEMDMETGSLSGLISMLPAHMVDDNGLKIIEENPEQRSSCRGHVADLDIASSYTRGVVVFNISKETTSREITDIAGVDEETQKMQNINLSAPRTNAVEYGVTMLKLPTFDTLLEAFNQKQTA